jgi:hypothetical protein
MKSLRLLKVARIFLPVLIFCITIFGGYCYAQNMHKSYAVIFLVVIISTIAYCKVEWTYQKRI